MKKILPIFIFMLISCQDSQVKWDATGTFEATEITVSAEGTGNILDLDLEEGSRLISGQVVGCIDTIQLYLRTLQLRSSSQGTLSRRSDIAKQIASLEQQITWQSSEKLRFENLVRQNAATQKQVDDIKNQIEVLEKQLVAQRSTLENTNRSLNDESSALEIQIAQIDDQLRKCKISSPSTGTVLVKFAEPGEFTTSGKPLFKMADLDRVYLRAYITADQLTQLKLNQEVKVYSDFGASEQREYLGRISWISDRSEFTPKTIQTRDERANLVYAIKISVHNDGYLKIGMYGQVIF